MKANLKQELVAIYRDTAERECEAVTQVNQQLLKQIKILREAQQRVIELGTGKILADSFFEAHQHLITLTDLCFKLNKMCSKAAISHDDHKSLQPDS